MQPGFGFLDQYEQKLNLVDDYEFPFKSCTERSYTRSCKPSITVTNKLLIITETENIFQPSETEHQGQSHLNTLQIWENALN
jgi:hypothetical protein